jgi:hypothetical protein
MSMIKGRKKNGSAPASQSPTLTSCGLLLSGERFDRMQCGAASTIERRRADRSSVFVFKDAGEHELKGVPDRWRLYRVVS